MLMFLVLTEIEGTHCARALASACTKERWNYMDTWELQRVRNVGYLYYVPLNDFRGMLV